MEPPTQLNRLPGEGPRAEIGQRAKWFLLYVVALSLSFGIPLLALLRFSLHSELYSHVLLIPFISGYLIWVDWQKISRVFEPALRLASFLFFLGIALLIAYGVAVKAGWQPGNENDRLSLFTLDFLFFLTGGFAWIFGWQIFRSVAFPILFLLFMVPMPLLMEDGMVKFLQLASAETSYWMLRLSGMPIFREGTEFTLPGVPIGVAPECSGIRSTLVLLMTGLLAAYFFLRRRWAQAALVALVIPLGILRNAVRIFTLAQLAVHVNPDILNSDLHHRGGPIFFAVSLVPFFLLIWLLRKCEAR